MKRSKEQKIISKKFFKLVDRLKSSDAYEKVKRFVESQPKQINEIGRNVVIAFGYEGTLLHFACFYGRIRVVSYLLSENAECSIKFYSLFTNNEFKGLTALEIAKKKKYQDIINLITEHTKTDSEKAATEKAAVQKAATEKAAVQKAAIEMADIEKGSEKAAVQKAATEKDTSEKTPALSYRMIDVNELNNALLHVPIYGISTTPLLFFEDAIKPLIEKKRVPRSRSYAQTACEFAKTFTNSPQPITYDGIAAMHLYTLEWTNKTDSLYYIMNECLRAQNREGLSDFFPYLKLLLTAMSCLPPTEEETVFRGLKGDYRKDYKKGEFIMWWGFSSCATHLEPVMEFLGEEGPRLLINVSFINGTKIREFSYFKGEEEVLLPPGRYFKVSSVGYQKDLTIVHLKEFPSEKIDGPFAKPFWQWRSDSGVWEHYDLKSSDVIECELKGGKDEIEITSFGQSYTINVKKYTQTNNTTGSVRKIQRIDPNDD